MNCWLVRWVVSLDWRYDRQLNHTSIKFVAPSGAGQTRLVSRFGILVLQLLFFFPTSLSFLLYLNGNCFIFFALSGRPYYSWARLNLYDLLQSIKWWSLLVVRDVWWNILGSNCHIWFFAYQYILVQSMSPSVHKRNWPGYIPELVYWIVGNLWGYLKWYPLWLMLFILFALSFQMSLVGWEHWCADTVTLSRAFPIYSRIQFS